MESRDRREDAISASRFIDDLINSRGPSRVVRAIFDIDIGNYLNFATRLTLGLKRECTAFRADTRNANYC